MDTIYLTYQRFLDAAKKFPRWSNLRRRPNNSVSGALLKSIINEIGKVEDAIIEYKKDFFIVNYIGREDKIVDYLYNAQIGNIEDLSQFTLLDPELTVTTDIKEFYANTNYAYYQDGYLVFRNEKESVKYALSNFIYTVPVERFHVWNIFDEFAWWVGLERFDGERNQSLMNRSINIFRYKPNSSETGLKNVIYNALSGYGYIDKDNEITFEIPGEDNITSDLYEAISQFNHDIARTKRWDIDYWDNTFRSLGYLPHEWDAPVKYYKDGVGYNNSLYVSTVKDLDEEGNTDVTIHGYKKSVAKIEEYIKNQNINKEFNLGLTKYNDVINPLQVKYKITASDLTRIENPGQVFVDSYLTSNKEKSYALDTLVTTTEEVTVKEKNKLESDKEYTLTLTPTEETFEISSCDLKDDSNTVSLLTPQGSFNFNDRGLFVNTKVLYHADSVTDFNSYTNLTDYRYGGVQLVEAMTPANIEIDISGLTKNTSQPLTVKSQCDLYDITSNQTYINYTGFTFNGSSYISGTSSVDPSTLTINFLGRDLEFELAKAPNASALTTGYVDVETYINDTIDNSHCYYNVSVTTFNKYSLKQSKMNDVKVIIKRKTTTPIQISNIKCSRYQITVTTSNNETLTLSNNGTVNIPRYSGEDYRLYLTIENYGNTKPIVNSIHIGATLNSLNSVYTVKFNTNGKSNPYLLLESNCNYRLTSSDGAEIDYSPYNSYFNDTDEIRAIYLDLSGFKNITYSSPEIKYSNGLPYISIAPDEELNSIIIYGQSEIQQSRFTLESIFNLTSSDSLYVNKNLKGFIKRTGSNEEFLELTETMCSNKSADTYRIWSSRYPNLTVCYISNSTKNVESINEKYTGRFESVYLYDKNSQDYIAYNTQNIIKNVTDNISIVKNFLPALPSGADLLYYIDTVETRSNNTFTVTFDNGNRWSTNSNKKIRIETDIDLSNSNVIDTTVTSINYSFALSNNIQLEDTYIVNDETIELGRYIIIPPENMVVVYNNVTVQQSKEDDGGDIYVKEDGFNKLYYSNIVNIERITANGIEISNDKYTLLNEEGIICWNDNSLVGQKIELVYTYQKPQYLTFSSLDYLYNLVGYYIDTLEEVTTIQDYIIPNCETGTIIQIDYNYFIEKPDRIIAECINPCYTGIFNNDTVLITKIADDNNIVIHNGYYYIDGKEYWYFADKYQYETNRLDGVKMVNVEKTDAGLLLKPESVNYLKNSRMICNTMDTHCMFDFNYYRNIPNISSLDHIGACDSYSAWHDYNMNISLGTDHDGQVINFSQTDSDAYAILDITKALQINKFISCWYSGNLKFALGREITTSNYRFRKSLYVERIADFNLYNDKAYLDCKTLVEDDTLYYLIVTGSGTLIETIISDTDSVEDINDDHEKVISKLGLVITEEAEAGDTITLDFTPVGSVLTTAEIEPDNTIMTGMSVDWGITQSRVYDLSSQITNGFLYRNGNLISQSDNSYLETDPIRINDRNIVFNLFLKINDYPYGRLKDFNVQVLGSNSLNGIYNELLNVTNTNLVIVQSTKLTGYIKFRITAKENQVITGLELYTQYRESASSALRVNKYDSGSLLTKVYDTCITANYLVKEIIADIVNPDKVKFYVRAARINNTDTVWTDWYNIEDNHIFNEYQLFQFKVDLSSSDAKVNIKQIIMEVTE